MCSQRRSDYAVHELEIEQIHDCPMSHLLRDELGAQWPAPGEPNLAEENLQARIRGNLLMALSNRFGWLVLTTGNKSEMSVGYRTLYGDLAGGLAVIKDVPKTLVYRLCEWRNASRAAGVKRARAPAPIPASVFERAPSAELRPDQRDEDSLPPYELLDRILAGLRRARPEPRAADRSRASPRGRRAHHPPRRSGRVQAPPGASRDQGHRARLRPRPAHADHQPLPGMSRIALIRRLAAASAPVPRWPACPAGRPLLRARARRPCGDTAAGPADPAQHAREPVGGSVSRCTGSAALFDGLAITEADPRPGGAFSVQYGDCLWAARARACRRCAWSPPPTTAFSRRQLAPHRRAHPRRPRRVAQEGSDDRARHRRRRPRDLCRRAALARAAARTIAPINARRSRRGAAAAPARHGLRETPLPGAGARLRFARGARRASPAQRSRRAGPRAARARRSSCASPRTCARRRR